MKISYLKIIAQALLCLLCCQHGMAGSNKLLIIESQNGEPYKSLREAMLHELSMKGFVQGKNLNITYYAIGNNTGPVRYFAKKHDLHAYDAIFSNGTIATIALKKYLYGKQSAKIVFGAITDPVGVGVIDNFTDPPKANFTGVSYPVKVSERLAFIQKVMPECRNIGFIYSAMPQSLSYKKWLDQEMKKEEFSNLRIIYRSVPFVASEGGHIRMARLAEKHIIELDPMVDVFLSPNDQMGARKPFAVTVYETATKPLVGLGCKDVMEDWGAVMSIYPCMDAAGKQIARMIDMSFNGVTTDQMIPRTPEPGYAFNLNKAKEFHINIPDDLLKAAGKNIIK